MLLKNQLLATQSKAEALSKALVKSWEDSLPADIMTDENKKAIYALAQKFPQESVKMMEIAHKASSKYKETRQELHNTKALTERKLLEQQVAGVIQKRSRNQYEPVQQTVHAASVKKARVAQEEISSANNPFAFRRNTMSKSMKNVKETAPQLFAALSNFSGGSVKSNMDSLLKCVIIFN